VSYSWGIKLLVTEARKPSQRFRAFQLAMIEQPMGMKDLRTSSSQTTHHQRKVLSQNSVLISNSPRVNVRTTIVSRVLRIGRQIMTCSEEQTTTQRFSTPFAQTEKRPDKAFSPHTQVSPPFPSEVSPRMESPFPARVSCHPRSDCKVPPPSLVPQ